MTTPQDPATRLHELVPHPAQLHPKPGTTFTLTPETEIHITTESARIPAELLAEVLRPSTGYRLPITTEPPPGPAAITLHPDPARKTGQEGYHLDITDSEVTIRAATTAGHFNAVATLRQLLPPEAEARTEQEVSWTIPGAGILDHPRYRHRGAMLDVARHFFTTDQVKRYLDQIAAFKINYFHLHLTDDQGWRLEIKSWPDLTRIGGSTEVGGRTGDLFYTQDEYTDLVTYAQTRGITLIPELDMPGHTNAARASYAELNRDGQKRPLYTGTEVGFSSLCIDEDVTYEFVEDVIREVAALTPGPYLHIGGDEALSTSDADYETFMSRVLPIVAKHGKRVIGWHEFIKTTEDSAAIPQFWNTTTSDATVAAAARRGSEVLMSPANRVYLDMKYDENTELGLDWAGHVEVRDAYDWNPGTHLAGVTEADVRGVEAPLWTETVRTSAEVEHLAFPRLAVAAELGWAPESAHDWDRFKRALGAQGPRWEVRGVRFHRSPQVPWQVRSDPARGGSS
ncbi:hexosaminidase [Lentzea xinjiangensis]|uniref:beta-N-acetylhexosaminidase n=1 Tax=Lentzea xinjiangensis TaxID=402600 RepID=A0A1H9V9M8_9PSEU|nr:beta-N-acetylhexosaminidase [Lentzea xinjiangensis]SES18289.1 hexosaminidase [Lentzea xinjiangensis]